MITTAIQPYVSFCLLGAFSEATRTLPVLSWQYEPALITSQRLLMPVQGGTEMVYPGLPKFNVCDDDTGASCSNVWNGSMLYASRVCCSWLTTLETRQPALYNASCRVVELAFCEPTRDLTMKLWSLLRCATTVTGSVPVHKICLCRRPTLLKHSTESTVPCAYQVDRCRENVVATGSVSTARVSAMKVRDCHGLIVTLTLTMGD